MKAKCRTIEGFKSCVGAAMFATLFAAAATATAADYLADRHIARGMSCKPCHRESPPSKPVKSQQCESCHGNNDEMAKQTKDVKPNPHFNHLGDVACLECHQAHQPPKLICDSCHKFELKVP
jgi:hypothetical protein